jgi:hypothetical protein
LRSRRYQLAIRTEQFVVLGLKLPAIVNRRNTCIVNAVDPLKQLVRVNLVDKALGVMEGVVAEKVG